MSGNCFTLPLILHRRMPFMYIFQEIGSRLYLFNNNNTNKTSICGYSFLTLVKGNKSNFARCEIEGVDKVIVFHRAIGMPGYKIFFKLLDSCHYPECNITSDDTK
jgi:hypothetical protein